MDPKIKLRPDAHWSVPTASVSIGPSDVHVWRAALDVGTSCAGKFHPMLSEDEQTRAGRFYFRKDRERFIVARGLLRSILGCYLNIEPGHVRFEYGAYGKPALAPELGAQGIRFNLSHSDGLALYAIARGREVGVDVEQLRPDFAGSEIAKRFFSAREVSMLFALPENLRVEAFFHCWTRKEAYIKARGEGLTLPLSDFDVSLIPGEPARLLYTSAGPKETSRWNLGQLNVSECDFVAALAVEGHDWQLKCWQWRDGFELVSSARSYVPPRLESQCRNSQ